MTANASSRVDLADILGRGIDALGLRLSADQQANLLAYLELMQRWNGTYNLTAIREPERMASHHLLDSLAVINPLKAAVNPNAPQAPIIDVGSGAGLPGVVLAVVWPQVPVVLVEPVAKKCAFLRQCAAQLGLTNLHIEERRIQDLSADHIPGDAAPTFICRAYTRLVDFATQVRPLCLGGSLVAAMKSIQTNEEIAEFQEAERIIAAKQEDNPDNLRLSLIRIESLNVPGIDAVRSLVMLGASRDGESLA